MNTAQLLSILDAAEIDPRSYRVLQEGRDDGLCLLREEGAWLVFYSDRGDRFDSESYGAEDEACVAFLRWMLRLNAVGARTARPIPPSDSPS